MHIDSDLLHNSYTPALSPRISNSSILMILVARVILMGEVCLGLGLIAFGLRGPDGSVWSVVLVMPADYSKHLAHQHALDFLEWPSRSLRLTIPRCVPEVVGFFEQSECLLMTSSFLPATLFLDMAHTMAVATLHASMRAVLLACRVVGVTIGIILIFNGGSSRATSSTTFPTATAIASSSITTLSDASTVSILTDASHTNDSVLLQPIFLLF